MNPPKQNKGKPRLIAEEFAAKLLKCTSIEEQKQCLFSSLEKMNQELLKSPFNGLPRPKENNWRQSKFSGCSNYHSAYHRWGNHNDPRVKLHSVSSRHCQGINPVVHSFLNCSNLKLLGLLEETEEFMANLPTKFKRPHPQQPVNQMPPIPQEYLLAHYKQGRDLKITLGLVNSWSKKHNPDYNNLQLTIAKGEPGRDAELHKLRLANDPAYALDCALRSYFYDKSDPGILNTKLGREYGEIFREEIKEPLVTKTEPQKRVIPVSSVKTQPQPQPTMKPSVPNSLTDRDFLKCGSLASKITGEGLEFVQLMMKASPSQVEALLEIVREQA